MLHGTNDCQRGRMLAILADCLDSELAREWGYLLEDKLSAATNAKGQPLARVQKRSLGQGHATDHPMATSSLLDFQLCILLSHARSH